MGSGGDKTRTTLGRKKLPDKLDIMILGLGRENSKPTPRSLAGVALREMGKGKWLSRGEDEQALAWGLVMKGAHPRNPVLGAVDRQHSTLQTVDPGRRPKSGPKKKKNDVVSMDELSRFSDVLLFKILSSCQSYFGKRKTNNNIFSVLDFECLLVSRFEKELEIS